MVYGMMTMVKIQMGGQEKELEVVRQGEMVRVVVDGKTAVFRLLHTDGNTLILEQQGADGDHQLVRVAGHSQGDKRQLWINGRSLTYERVRPRQSGTADSHDPSLASTIPAVVSKILVAVGDPVAAGDKLILLESMKMVIPILAPHDGTVTALHCQAGDSVQAGIALIELSKD